MNAKRLIYNELESNLLSRPIKILLGARQVGKTHLLKALDREARHQGLTTAYFNLEIPADIVKFSDDKVQVFNFLTSAARILFIDEFHYLPNIASLFKAVYDSGAKVSIFASGSSALEIHKNLKESLAGRRFIYNVYPLSFEECLNNHLPTENYLVEGGVPGLLHLPAHRDKQVYLNGLVETYILKDVKALIKEENVKAFNHLLYFLAEHQGSVITMASLAQEVGLTARTVEKHLSILEQTYICYGLSSYSTRLSNELKKSKKYYFFDLGIRNAILKNFDYALDQRPDKGVLLESAVFLELMKKCGPDSSLCFWRTKQQKEVDFIKLINRKPVPIEVKSHAQQDSLPEGLKAFIDRYPSTEKAYVVSFLLTGHSRYKNCEVKFITLKDVASI